MTLIDGGDVALPTTITLSFNHDAAFFRCHHVHLEASALDLGLVDARSALFSGQNWLCNLLHLLQRFKLLFTG